MEKQGLTAWLKKYFSLSAKALKNTQQADFIAFRLLFHIDKPPVLADDFENCLQETSCFGTWLVLLLSKGCFT